MSSIFTKIINREIPSNIFYEDEKFIAILDINPVRDGHILVIPKKETESIFELDDHEYSELMLTTKKIALMLEEKLKDKINLTRIGMAVEGIDVPHVHVHLIPIADGFGFTLEHRNKFSFDEIKEILLSDN